MQDVHPDFPYHSSDGLWRLNCKNVPEDLDIKIRFGLDDLALLDDCPFYAKVGENRSPSLAGRYVGFAYAKKSELLKLGNWARRFSRADLTIGLDRNGVATTESEIARIA